MKNALKFFPLLFLLLFTCVPADASTLAYPDTLSATGNNSIELPESSVNLKKPGFFQRLHAVKTVQKMAKKVGKTDEKTGNLAQIALLLFIAFIALMLLSQVATILVYCGGIAYVLSFIIAAMALKESNPKSRHIAKVILVIDGFVAVVGFLLLILFLAFLTA